MESRPLPEDENAQHPQPPPTQEEDGADGEFRIVVRKLELPVRPRGVLAE